MDWTNKNCFSHEVLKLHSGTGVFDIKQSPINIDSQAVNECHLLCNLEIHYKSSKCHVERTPQGIATLTEDVMTSPDKSYIYDAPPLPLPGEKIYEETKFIAEHADKSEYDPVL